MLADSSSPTEVKAEAAKTMRDKFLPRAASEGALIAATHMPFPGSVVWLPTAERCAGRSQTGHCRIEVGCGRLGAAVHEVERLTVADGLSPTKVKTGNTQPTHAIYISRRVWRGGRTSFGGRYT